MTDAKTRIVFTGDIVFCGYFGNGWSGKGCLSHDVSEYLMQADHVVGNIECPFTDAPIQSDRLFNLSGSTEAGKYLRSVNITNWVLANNHIKDCGDDGLLETIRTAHENDCKTVGAGENESEAAEPLVLGDEVKVGIVSVAREWKHIKVGKNTPGALTIDKAIVAETIKRLKKTVDWVVVVSHGGNEFSSMPMPYTRDSYLGFLDAGADIVIGHHPHVIQNYEYVGEKLIVYSLGNFIFDSDRQRSFKHTDEGMLVGLDFRADGFSMDGYPVLINREANLIEKGTVPAIFQSIGVADYEQLWPLAARKRFQADFLIHRLYSRRKALYRSGILFSLRCLYTALKNPEERVIQKGRLLSLFHKYKQSKLKDVIHYLNA